LSRKLFGLSDGNKGHAEALEETPARLLHDQVAAKRFAVSTRITRTLVAGDALEHGGEAGPFVDGVGAAHGRVVELVDQLVARAFGEGLQGLLLPFGGCPCPLRRWSPTAFRHCLSCHGLPALSVSLPTDQSERPIIIVDELSFCCLKPYI
jgi:hypothetical protein